MFVLFLGGVTTAYWAEARGNPIHAARGSTSSRRRSPAATWRARRSGSASPTRALYATVTTDASCGAVNAMHDSFTPIGGLVPLVNMQLGELIFGGVGAGLYGMLVMVVLTVFIAGLMVGRTPEYLGKKIQAREVQMAMLYVLDLPGRHPRAHARSPPCCRPGLKGLNNAGPHGLSEILYAFTSTPGNNGSAFAGLTGVDLLLQHAVRRGHADRPLRDDRADARARPASSPSSRIAPETAGRSRSPRRSSWSLLVGVILIVGALTFFPALSLGPIVEHLLMQAGRLF